MKLKLRVVLIGLVAVVAIGALISTPGAKEEVKEKWTAGWCTSNGVSLTIENVSVETRCATDFKDTSWNLFVATGNKVRGTNNYPTGFVCQINGLPAEQDCVDTPRYDEGTWAFFIAAAGTKSWTYAATGAGRHFSECGSAEAWLFVPADASPETSVPSEKPVTHKCD